MNFYDDIAHRIYVNDTKIGDTTFHQWEDYLDAKNLESDYPGKIFWTNVMAAMVKNPPHFGLALRGDFYKEVLRFCKSRIDGVSEPVSKPGHFRDVLIIPDDLEFCLEALRKHKKPIIDADNNFLLGEKKKSVLSGWVDGLRLGYIKEGITNEQIAELIPTVIPNIKITDRTIENKGSAIAIDYASKIQFLLRR